MQIYRISDFVESYRVEGSASQTVVSSHLHRIDLRHLAVQCRIGRIRADPGPSGSEKETNGRPATVLYMENMKANIEAWCETPVPPAVVFSIVLWGVLKVFVGVAS